MFLTVARSTPFQKFFQCKTYLHDRYLQCFWSLRKPVTSRLFWKSDNIHPRSHWSSDKIYTYLHPSLEYVIVISARHVDWEDQGLSSLPTGGWKGRDRGIEVALVLAGISKDFPQKSFTFSATTSALAIIPRKAAVMAYLLNINPHTKSILIRALGWEQFSTKEVGGGGLSTCRCQA